MLDFSVEQLRCLSDVGHDEISVCRQCELVSLSGSGLDYRRDGDAAMVFVAEIKIETFPHIKYCTIYDEVKHVSCDAIQDEKKGLIYSSRVKVGKSTILVENKPVTLSAGMAVTVEIKTGKRRVIEYFLTPLIQHTSESLRER